MHHFFHSLTFCQDIATRASRIFAAKRKSERVRKIRHVIVCTPQRRRRFSNRPWQSKKKGVLGRARTVPFERRAIQQHLRLAAVAEDNLRPLPRRQRRARAIGERDPDIVHRPSPDPPAAGLAAAAEEMRAAAVVAAVAADVVRALTRTHNHG